jgi:beta-lactamase superfamily II metal-dependent hydrolase
VKTLQGLGASVWVTGEQGSLLVETNGQNLKLTKLP